MWTAANFLLVSSLWHWSRHGPCHHHQLSLEVFVYGTLAFFLSFFLFSLSFLFLKELKCWGRQYFNVFKRLKTLHIILSCDPSDLSFLQGIPCTCIGFIPWYQLWEIRCSLIFIPFWEMSHFYHHLFIYILSWNLHTINQCPSYFSENIE